VDSHAQIREEELDKEQPTPQEVAQESQSRPNSSTAVADLFAENERKIFRRKKNPSINLEQMDDKLPRLKD